MTRQSKDNIGGLSSLESILKGGKTKEELPWLKYITPQAEQFFAAKEQEECKKQAQEVKEVGEVIRLPPRSSEDGILRLEQNLGCELPVCVGNRSDVKKECIEVVINGERIWRLERSAMSLLPAPEHYPIWLWFLDRCQVAARAGCVQAPRIPLDLPALAKDLGRKMNSRWYDDVNEAFSRLSRLIITAHKSFYLTGERPAVSSSVLGTICHYVSWREKDEDNKNTLVDGVDGWVAPGPLLWMSIRQQYLKAVPFLPISKLKSYVAQRLFLYLSKHCQAGRDFKISAAKLLPRVPLDCATNKIKYRLRPHHKALIDVGFLACEPLYDGRGSRLMVTYVRTKSDF